MQLELSTLEKTHFRGANVNVRSLLISQGAPPPPATNPKEVRSSARVSKSLAPSA